MDPSASDEPSSSRPNNPPPQGETQVAVPDPDKKETFIDIVAPTGNVILEFHLDEHPEVILCRAEIEPLAKNSGYFQRLLTNTNFAEAADVSKKLNELSSRYASAQDVPTEELPHVKIFDVGSVAVNKAYKSLITDTMLILHGNDIRAKKMPTQNLTNLCIAADRFDGLDVFAKWGGKKGVLARLDQANTDGATEEVLRQKLLMGVMLGNFACVSMCSRELILRGSKNVYDPNNAVTTNAIWWAQPRGVEGTTTHIPGESPMIRGWLTLTEEIHFRRQCILETIWSLISYTLDLYNSGDQQCRLGYNSSPQCDSFQLGEFVRFLNRNGFMKFVSGVSSPPAESNDGASWGSKHIGTLIDRLRQCPAYQLDQHHTHCGPKKLIGKGISMIETMLTDQGVGICVTCWNSKSALNQRWSDKRPLFWNSKMELGKGKMHWKHHQGDSAITEHHTGREMFTATEREWDLKT